MYDPCGAPALHTAHTASLVPLHRRAANVCLTTSTTRPCPSYTRYCCGLHRVHGEHTASTVPPHAREAYCPSGHAVHDTNSLSDRSWHPRVM